MRGRLYGRLCTAAAILAVVLGIGGAVVGVAILVDAWWASWAFAHSDEGRRSERIAEAEAPLWIEAPPPEGVRDGGVNASASVQAGDSASAGGATGTGSSPDGSVVAAAGTLSAGERAAGAALEPRASVTAPHQGASAAARAPARATGQVIPGSVASAVPGLTPDTASSPTAASPAGETHATLEVGTPEAVPARAPAPRAAPDEVAVASVDFRFLDPPQPGAHAVLSVMVENRSANPTGAIRLAVDRDWFGSFEVLGAVPAALSDETPDGTRTFTFLAVEPAGRQALALHVISRGEDVDAPDVRIVLDDGAEVAHVRPRTVAPKPRPGPARSIEIAKLGVRATVVQTAWEPPRFAIGQILGTAAVSLGNTVLVGHLRGPDGDVFAHLDRLRPGDEVVATSRGLPYRFVVSEVTVRPYDDLSATLPTETPRLSLMTCTGVWNPLRQDYSHRLWAIAEPPELAAQTIAMNAARAEQAAREAEEAAAQRAAHEAEAAAQEASAIVEAAAAEAAAAEAAAADSTAAASVALTEAPDSLAAVPEVAPPAAPTPTPGVLAVRITDPRPDAQVPARLLVRGTLADPRATRGPLWLVVRANVSDGRWYALDRPLDVRPDGSWQAEIVLGGPPNLRHEIRVGVADEAANATLLRHAREQQGQPLDALPDGYQTAASAIIIRR
ncbi:MAG: sortase [Chloroflexi bacterium]|nr:sortase [Chloroflexota bacterium]